MMNQNLANFGRGGDTELAHVNRWEADLLKMLGGSGTINPNTGLREYATSPAPFYYDSSGNKVNVSSWEQYFQDALGLKTNSALNDVLYTDPDDPTKKTAYLDLPVAQQLAMSTLSASDLAKINTVEPTSPTGRSYRFGMGTTIDDVPQTSILSGYGNTGKVAVSPNVNLEPELQSNSDFMSWFGENLATPLITAAGTSILGAELAPLLWGGSSTTVNAGTGTALNQATNTATGTPSLLENILTGGAGQSNTYASALNLPAFTEMGADAANVGTGVLTGALSSTPSFATDTSLAIPGVTDTLANITPTIGSSGINYAAPSIAASAGLSPLVADSGLGTTALTGAISPTPAITTTPSTAANTVAGTTAGTAATTAATGAATTAATSDLTKTLATLAGLGGLSYLSSQSAASNANDIYDKIINAQTAQQDKMLEFWKANAYPSVERTAAMKSNALSELNAYSQSSQENLMNNMAARGFRGGGMVASGLGDIERERLRRSGILENEITQFANTPMFAPNLAPIQGTNAISTASWDQNLYNLLGNVGGSYLYKNLLGS